MTIAELNALPHGEAMQTLLQCCGSREWADAVADERPFGSVDDLFAAAERIWLALPPSAWREAFRSHPRIGEAKAAAPTSHTENVWSAQEQAGMSRSSDGATLELAAAQREYEAKFGHIFLICATGLTAAHMLESLRGRMQNDAGAELRTAAHEQSRITRLRLEKLLGQ